MRMIRIIINNNKNKKNIKCLLYQRVRQNSKLNKIK